jgi:hypothetical protein
LAGPWADGGNDTSQDLLVAKEALAARATRAEGPRWTSSCHFRRIALPCLLGWLDFTKGVC